MENIPYSNAIGSVMYLMVSTRPDIAYVVSCLSRYMSNAGLPHWKPLNGYLEAFKEAIWLKGLLTEIGSEQPGLWFVGLYGLRVPLSDRANLSIALHSFLLILFKAGGGNEILLSFLKNSAPIPLRDPLFAYSVPGISCLPTFCLSTPRRSLDLSSTKSLEQAEARCGKGLKLARLTGSGNATRQPRQPVFSPNRHSPGPDRPRASVSCFFRNCKKKVNDSVALSMWSGAAVAETASKLLCQTRVEELTYKDAGVDIDEENNQDGSLNWSFWRGLPFDESPSGA
ncbi:Retrovirus-related Pol polyprotein from transposon TNT 1-94 [Sesamum angolense]|uniref:Retrovirus-related Pol polyprotein from transposon TNT 1-94 n=1 Tax=Sesamum angolense TaxID=2727404 RepID=A0AAE1W8L5_9LAMI|nr:Retrovirus-related Pol polyprotein from transposon TNT 1-94 [Sesamum angolense]